jgi:hypothetical protein
MQPKLHDHIRKSPLVFSVLSQMNPVHTLPPYFSKCYFQSMR